MPGVSNSRSSVPGVYNSVYGWAGIVYFRCGVAGVEVDRTCDALF